LAQTFKDYIVSMLRWPWLAGRLYGDRKVSTMAAAASFYLILTVVPTSLFLITILGEAMGDLMEIKKWMFSFGENFIPEAGRMFFEKLQAFLDGPLMNNSKFTIINLVFLAYSGISFINTIHNGLFLISGDRSHISWGRYLRGMILIGSSVAFLLVLLSLDPLIVLSLNLLKDNFLTNMILSVFEGLRPVVDMLTRIENSRGFLLKSSAFYFLVLGLYFSFVYRCFFNWRVSFKRSVMASSFFVFLLLLGKNLFWIYLQYGRQALMKNYGDFYTVVVVLIWMYLLMSFFYFGACLCVINPLTEEKGLSNESEDDIKEHDQNPA
jgi:membrane protein